MHGAEALDEGEVLQFETDQDFVLTATGPVTVTQTMLGQAYLDTTAGSDPAMGTGIPWTQTRSEYDFFVPSTYE